MAEAWAVVAMMLTCALAVMTAMWLITFKAWQKSTSRDARHSYVPLNGPNPYASAQPGMPPPVDYSEALRAAQIDLELRTQAGTSEDAEG